jgi:DNA-binding transcriptional LysR family regulator
MDRFASITAFVRVTENGGFSAAARRLKLSKAAVSEQVQALENLLGIRLLNRTTRRVSLTERGREYYERCVQMLHDLDEANQSAGAAQPAPRGPASRALQFGRGMDRQPGRSSVARSRTTHLGQEDQFVPRG